MTETMVAGGRLALEPTADKALAAAARLWFAAALIGQWAFFYYILRFYGPSTASGHFEAWSRNKNLFTGYVAGDIAGNLFFAAHALLAGVTSLGGVLQLVPQIRQRAPGFHRWNGRLFLLAALMVSGAGLYLVWVRGSVPNLTGLVATTLNALLIIGFSLLAWRSAWRRQIAQHRRWALRAYLVANAQWFTRIGFFAWLIVMRGPVGLTDDFDGPFNYFIGFGCYLVPLAVLELYLRARDGAGPRRRLAVAAGLVAATLVMSIGIAGFYVMGERPLLATLR
jgi:hypothetical protein